MRTSIVVSAWSRLGRLIVLAVIVLAVIILATVLGCGPHTPRSGDPPPPTSSVGRAVADGGTTPADGRANESSPLAAPGADAAVDRAATTGGASCAVVSGSGSAVDAGVDAATGDAGMVDARDAGATVGSMEVGHAGSGGSGGATGTGGGGTGGGLGSGGTSGRGGASGSGGSSASGGAPGSGGSLGGTGGGVVVAPRPGAGDLAIVELLINPAGTDTGREWIEIVNRTSHALELSGLVVADAANEAAVSFATDGDGGAATSLPAGARGVLIQSTDPTRNGGVTVGGAIVGGSFGTLVSLNNDADTISVCEGSCATGVVVARVQWDATLGAGYDGHALVIDDAGRRCPAPLPFGDAGSFGTPGEANADCP